MGIDNTGLAHRMKWYEQRYTQDIMLPFLPVLARIDGRSFHTYTRNFERPYDLRMSKLMISTMKYLMEETHALCGYVQSDEISLLWLREDFESGMFFDGKLHKMVSVLASLSAAHFNVGAISNLPSNRLAAFDCRVWQVPTKTEAANYFVWREMDAARNSVQMAARASFSHGQCDKKNNSELQEMLFQKGINWNDYPVFFKRGTFGRRSVVQRTLTPEEIAVLPPKHALRANPEPIITRTVINTDELPQLKTIENREMVLFEGANPKLKEAVS